MELMRENPQPSRFFPQDRIQNFLRSCDGQDINQDVQVEGAFIQLSDEGLPLRQVYIAITKEDFIIAKQEMRMGMPFIFDEYEDYDLSVEEIIPLPILHFFIIDDRAKRFTICTSVGDLYHFEMCLLDFFAEHLWVKWHGAIARLTGRDGHNFDASSKRTSYVVKIDEKYHKQFEKTRSKYGAPSTETMHFIHNPMTFRRVAHIGIQTENVDANVVKRGQDVCFINKRNNQGFIGVKRPCSVTFSSSSESSDDGRNVRPLSSGNDIILRDRLAFLYTGNEIWRKMFTDRDGQLTRSNSVGHIDMNARKESVKLSIKKHDLSKAKKLQKFRDRFGKVQKEKCDVTTSSLGVVGDVDSGSESDEDDVDKAFDEITQKIKHNDKVRNGRFLWSLAKCLVLKKGEVSQLNTNLTKVVHEATFKKLMDSQTPLPPSLTDFDPLDVSNHMTYVSRRLFLLVTVADIEMITWSNGQQIPKSVTDVLQFHDVIVRVVVTETLQNSDGMTGKIRALKFFIQVSSNLLFRHNDYQSLTAILKGLTSLPLYHINSLWANLFVQEPFAFCHFMTMVKILSSTNQYTAYITRVETCRKRDVPFIPWMDHILQHCVSRKFEENIQMTHSQTMGKVLRTVGLLEMRAKWTKSPKKDAKQNGEDHNTSKSFLTLNKRNRKWSLTGSSRSQKKVKQTVRFDLDENDGDELYSTNSEEMKRRAKASWVHRTDNDNDTEMHVDNEETVNNGKDTGESGGIGPVIGKYSDNKARDIITDAVSEAIGEENCEANTGNGSRVGAENISRDNDFAGHDFTKQEDGKCITDTGDVPVVGEDVTSGGNDLTRHSSTTKEDGVTEVSCGDVNDASVSAERKREDNTKAANVKRKKKSNILHIPFFSKRNRKREVKKLQKLIENLLPEAVDISVVVEANEDKDKKNDGERKDEDESNKEEVTDSQELEPPQPMRLAPKKETSGRRKSLFEEALESHITEEEENEAFEALKSSHSRHNDAIQSALDLLTVEDDTDYISPKDKNWRTSIMESIADLFGGRGTGGANSKGSNRKGSASVNMESKEIETRFVDLRPVKDVPKQQSVNHKPNDGHISKQIRRTRKTDQKHVDGSNINQNSKKAPNTGNVTCCTSQDRVEYMSFNSNKNKCCLCANKQCLYGERISTQLAKYQLKLLEMKTIARHRVKEYLQLVMDVYDCRSYIDILQLSFEDK